MNLLFFSDMHGNLKVLDSLKNKAKEADGIVCSGDFTVFEEDIEKILKKLSKFDKKVLLIHGNHEDEDRVRDLCEKHDNISFLHKGVFHAEDYIFMGYGGDGFSTNDPEFERVAKFFKEESKDKKRIVLFTHGPPHGTVIDKINGEHRGNKSYRNFIDDVKPHLVISGHFHENAGKTQKIGRTLFVNPGPHGAFIDI
ncbi:hypothetical protein HN789_05660 [archaeon]|jgi:uncharacterized protein|nr:hypothetical protein [archaeon]MBT4023000.1 hypothetical protein [archaeon]MBT4271991.1 hypothetical protein [archaeon]MBT4461829.1 hypothetical protein [archaeon]MBT4858156.1 hypothetical protein [archaeon]